MTAPLHEDIPTDTSTVSAGECERLGVPSATVWQWASRGLVIDGRRRKLSACALDASGKPLYLKADVIKFRDRRRVAVAGRLSGCQASELTTYAQNRPDYPLRTVGPSRVQRSEGAVVDPQPPSEIVVPVRLDFTDARKQLDEFSAHVTRTLSAAVATGLDVHGLTVDMRREAKGDPSC